MNHISQQLSEKTKKQQPSENARPEFDGERYIIKKESYGTIIDDNRLRDVLNEAIKQLKPVVDLEKEDCYITPELRSNSMEVKECL